MNREADSMNRWIRWARQLRWRHGRKEVRRSTAAMVLARRPIGGAALFRIAGSPIHIHLCPRLGVTLAAAAPMQLATMGQAAPATRVHARVVSAPVDRSHVQPMGWFRPAPDVDPAEAARADAAQMPDSAPLTFAQRFVAAPVRRVAEAASQPQHIYRLARMWRDKPPAARAAAELPVRLRLRGRRTELPAAAIRELVAAAPGRRETPATVAAPDSLAPARAGYQPFAQPAPTAVPPINVEELTSQVIQQLDRRLVAHRERMGRS